MRPIQKQFTSQLCELIPSFILQEQWIPRESSNRQRPELPHKIHTKRNKVSNKLTPAILSLLNTVCNRSNQWRWWFPINGHYATSLVANGQNDASRFANLIGLVAKRQSANIVNRAKQTTNPETKWHVSAHPSICLWWMSPGPVFAQLLSNEMLLSSGLQALDDLQIKFTPRTRWMSVLAQSIFRWKTIEAHHHMRVIKIKPNSLDFSCPQLHDGAQWHTFIHMPDKTSKVLKNGWNQLFVKFTWCSK